MNTVVADAPFRLPDDPVETDLLAKYFRALGHPARLEVLDALVRRGELAVRELVEQVGLPQPKVSDHLACLRWCGFVETRREHRVVRYRVADQRVAEVVALGRQLLRENADHVAACRLVCDVE